MPKKKAPATPADALNAALTGIKAKLLTGQIGNEAAIKDAEKVVREAKEMPLAMIAMEMADKSGQPLVTVTDSGLESLPQLATRLFRSLSALVRIGYVLRIKEAGLDLDSEEVVVDLHEVRGDFRNEPERPRVHMDLDSTDEDEDEFEYTHRPREWGEQMDGKHHKRLLVRRHSATPKVEPEKIGPHPYDTKAKALGLQTLAEWAAELPRLAARDEKLARECWFMDILTGNLVFDERPEVNDYRLYSELWHRKDVSRQARGVPKEKIVIGDLRKWRLSPSAKGKLTRIINKIRDRAAASLIEWTEQARTERLKKEAAALEAIKVAKKPRKKSPRSNGQPATATPADEAAHPG